MSVESLHAIPRLCPETDRPHAWIFQPVEQDITRIPFWECPECEALSYERPET